MQVSKFFVLISEDPTYIPEETLDQVRRSGWTEELLIYPTSYVISVFFMEWEIFEVFYIFFLTVPHKEQSHGFENSILALAHTAKNVSCGKRAANIKE